MQELLKVYNRLSNLLEKANSGNYSSKQILTQANSLIVNSNKVVEVVNEEFRNDFLLYSSKGQLGSANGVDRDLARLLAALREKYQLSVIV